MSDIDGDVKNLFKKIGGVEPAYQELRRESRSEQARGRWPLLHSLQAEEGAAPATEPGMAPPPLKPATVSEIRPAKKSGLSKLFKSLEGGKTPAKKDAPVVNACAAAEKEPFSGLFAQREATPPEAPEAQVPGLFHKRTVGQERAPNVGVSTEKAPFSSLFAQRKAIQDEPEVQVPGLFKKRPGADAPAQVPNLFNRLFEPQETPANFWQSMFDKLKKS